MAPLLSTSGKAVGAPALTSPFRREEASYALRSANRERRVMVLPARRADGSMTEEPRVVQSGGGRSRAHSCVPREGFRTYISLMDIFDKRRAWEQAELLRRQTELMEQQTQQQHREAHQEQWVPDATEELGQQAEAQFRAAMEVADRQLQVLRQIAARMEYVVQALRRMELRMDAGASPRDATHPEGP